MPGPVALVSGGFFKCQLSEVKPHRPNSIAAALCFAEKEIGETREQLDSRVYLGYSEINYNAIQYRKIITYQVLHCSYSPLLQKAFRFKSLFFILMKSFLLACHKRDSICIAIISDIEVEKT